MSIKKLTARGFAFCLMFFCFMGAKHVIYADSLAVVNGTNVNIRTGGTLDAEVFTQLHLGQQVTIKEDAGEFFRISFDGSDNLYVYKEFVNVEQAQGMICADNVNIRKYPSTNHDALSQASYGEVFQVTGKSGEWYGISYNGEDAFVHSNYITGSFIDYVKTVNVSEPMYLPESEPEDYSMYAVVNASDGLRLRALPSTEAAVLTVFSYGMSMDVIEDLGEWTKVSLGGTIGYVSSVYVNLNEGKRPETPNSRAQDILAFAKQFLGTPYVWGGTSLTRGVDCSGFVFSVMKNFGVSLSRTSRDMYHNGFEVSKGSLSPGDLVFFDTDGNGRISHVGIYMGNGQFIHSSSSKRSWGVTISSLNEDYYQRTYLRACRVL